MPSEGTRRGNIRLSRTRRYSKAYIYHVRRLKYTRYKKIFKTTSYRSRSVPIKLENNSTMCTIFTLHSLEMKCHGGASELTENRLKAAISDKRRITSY